MSTMMELLKKLDCLPIAPVSDGADKQNNILLEELPFVVHEYDSGREFNGWVCPKKWEVVTATIKRNGKLVYDGKAHPLGVISYSEAFTGKITLEELKEHLFYFKDSPDDIIYHCDLYYKPHKKMWGFCIPYNVFKSLEECEYEIELVTIHEPGKMKVLEYVHQGESDKTIVFNAHNCHASQLNDGPAGYVAFMEMLKRLKGRKTKYSYKLVVAPEHLGTVFYLADMDEKDIKKHKLGMFMEMIAHDNPVFSLQESFTGKSLIDKVAHHVLGHTNGGYWSAGYRQFLGNDESVWEAPGYEVPMVSLSRCESVELTFPQYHLSSDNYSLMCEDKLEETVETLLKMINILEKNCLLQRKFTGLIALSNPKYDLYQIPGTDPSMLEEDRFSHRKKWFDLMNGLFRYMDQNMTVLDIAIKYELPFEEVYDYIVKFEEKGLAECIAIDEL
jgi:aminopeptidase-like protein